MYIYIYIYIYIYYELWPEDTQLPVRQVVAHLGRDQAPEIIVTIAMVVIINSNTY